VKSVVVHRQKKRIGTNLPKALPTVQETKRWMNHVERSRIAMIVTALLPTSNQQKQSPADTIQHKDGVSTKSNSSIDAAGPFC
jgi:hypothetical protein